MPQNIQKLQVGAPYPGVLPLSDNVHAEFFRHGTSRLLITMSGLTPQEEQDYRTGRTKAGIVEIEGLIVLLWKFGGQPWVDAPFDAAAILPEERSIPEITEPEQRLAVEIQLVDLSTGIVRGLRLLTLSPALTRALIQSATKQTAPVPQSVYNKFYAHPTSEWVERALFKTWCG